MCTARSPDARTAPRAVTPAMTIRALATSRLGVGPVMISCSTSSAVAAAARSAGANTDSATRRVCFCTRARTADASSASFFLRAERCREQRWIRPAASCSRGPVRAARADSGGWAAAVRENPRLRRNTGASMQPSAEWLREMRRLWDQISSPITGATAAARCSAACTGIGRPAHTTTT